MQVFLLLTFTIFASARDLYCPGVDDAHVELGTVEFKNGGWTLTGDARISSKTSWNLLGGYIEFDMDTTETQPGVISTFYTSSPEVANCGFDCYCDINHPARPCMEMDFVESNGNCVMATTTHTHATAGVKGNRDCDKWGCASKTSLRGTPAHIKAAFATDGSLAVYLDGEANNQYFPVPSNASNEVVVETMERVGAAFLSSQWYSSGWAPGKDSCPPGSQDKLASSKFSISNLRVMGTVKKGPAPPKCVTSPVSSTTSSPARSTTGTTAPAGAPTATTNGNQADSQGLLSVAPIVSCSFFLQAVALWLALH